MLSSAIAIFLMSVMAKPSIGVSNWKCNINFSPKWQLALAFTHARHTYENNRLLNDININGNDIDTAPRNVANVRLGYAPMDSLEFALEWQAMGSYYTDPENLHEYEGHDVFKFTCEVAVDSTC